MNEILYPYTVTPDLLFLSLDLKYFILVLKNIKIGSFLSRDTFCNTAGNPKIQKKNRSVTSVGEFCFIFSIICHKFIWNLPNRLGRKFVY